MPVPSGYTNKFVTDIPKILDRTRGGVDYPHLHEVFTGRLPYRNAHLSRCWHRFPGQRNNDQMIQRTKQREDRTDSPYYQLHYRGDGKPSNDRRSKDRITVINEICPLVKEDRFVIYGIIGTGTYGTIFAARERGQDHPRHVALKVEIHEPLASTSPDSKNALWIEHDGEEHYIPVEAMFMEFLGDCDRFPVLNSVYTHQKYHVIVMSPAAIDYSPLRDTATEEGWHGDSFSACTGNELIDEKKPRLTEIEVCQIASQILEAMMYLMDMHTVHSDLSHNNYVVDEDLNITLLDFGVINFSLDEDGFRKSLPQWLPFQEYQMTPEMAIELKKRHWERKLRSNPQKWQTLYLPYDTRVLNLWKFGVLIYELLHGYSPWEEPEWDGRIGGLRKWAKNLRRSGRMSERKVRERRDRIINEELPIDENLSQDCVDVLRAMLTKDIEKRPTLRQLASFPWFQGHWVDRGPFSRPPRKEPSEDGEMDDWSSVYPETC